MFINRLRVNDFKVLKNLDLQFDKDFQRKIFPLGSVNGGGKSTLLQLIFILLHCSSDIQRHQYIKNLLEGYNFDPNDPQKELLYLDIYDEDYQSSIQVTFFICGQKFLDPLKEQIEEDKWNYITFNYDTLIEKKRLIIYNLQGFIDNKNIDRNTLQNFSTFLIYNAKHIVEDVQKNDPTVYQFIVENTKGTPSNVETFQDRVKTLQDSMNSYLSKTRSELDIYIDTKQKIQTYLNEHNLEKIVVLNSNDLDSSVLAFQIKGIPKNDSSKYLEKLSNHVYLAAPSTQMFLFLPSQTKNALFEREINASRPNDSVHSYSMNLEISKVFLKHLFTYEILSVKHLIGVFNSVSTMDFKSKIETGTYGKNIDTLHEELSDILNGLIVKPTIDEKNQFTGVSFFKEVNGKNVQLFPKDFSHGELKRLSIFVWMKHLEIKNSIVLMDEIEIAFHPDWQYLIVKDLEKWGQGNQYILATHSYSLCEAVTPQHVKEIDFQKGIENFGK